jgi:putative peptidoglycan lipid II flippase
MVANIALGAAIFFALRQAGFPGFPGLAVATSAAAWLNVILMIRSLVARGAYGPTPAAIARLARIVLASAALFVLLWFADANRPELEARFGSKEGAVLFVILGGGAFYFALAFIVRAVTLAEVRGAFRRERGAPAEGGALPPGLDG